MAQRFWFEEKPTGIWCLIYDNEYSVKEAIATARSLKHAAQIVEALLKANDING